MHDRTKHFKRGQKKTQTIYTYEDNEDQVETIRNQGGQSGRLHIREEQASHLSKLNRKSGDKPHSIFLIVQLRSLARRAHGLKWTDKNPFNK